MIGATFFHNDSYDIIAYLNSGALLSIGVPAGVIAALPGGQYRGATVNAISTRALGTELESKTNLGHGLIFQGEYTYLDAVVTKAFGDPVFSPPFPTIPIGDYSPLQGARPFRRAPHSGSLILTYSRNKHTAALSGSFVGRRVFRASIMMTLAASIDCGEAILYSPTDRCSLLSVNPWNDSRQLRSEPEFL